MTTDQQPQSTTPNDDASAPATYADKARVFPFALTLFALGAAIASVSILTAAAAPPTADVKTAAYIGIGAFVILAICALLTLMTNKAKALGMIGIHLGLIFPLLLMTGPLMRVGGAFEKSTSYYEAIAEQAELPEAEQVIPVYPEDHEDAGLARRPWGYVAVGQGSIAALSLFGFVALLAQRPAPSKRKG